MQNKLGRQTGADSPPLNLHKTDVGTKQLKLETEDLISLTKYGQYETMGNSVTDRIACKKNFPLKKKLKNYLLLIFLLLKLLIYYFKKLSAL